MTKNGLFCSDQELEKNKLFDYASITGMWYVCIGLTAVYCEEGIIVGCKINPEGKLIKYDNDYYLL